MKRYVQLFEEHGRETDEEHEAIQTELAVVKDKLETFKPFFEYDGSETDSQLRNDGSGDYDVWVEYHNVDPKVVEDLTDNYDQFHWDFAEWFGKVGLENDGVRFEQVMSTEDSITYSVIVTV